MDRQAAEYQLCRMYVSAGKFKDDALIILSAQRIQKDYPWHVLLLMNDDTALRIVTNITIYYQVYVAVTVEHNKEHNYCLLRIDVPIVSAICSPGR